MTALIPAPRTALLAAVLLPALAIAATPAAARGGHGGFGGGLHFGSPMHIGAMSSKPITSGTMSNSSALKKFSPRHVNTQTAQPLRLTTKKLVSKKIVTTGNSSQPTRHLAKRHILKPPLIAAAAAVAAAPLAVKAATKPVVEPISGRNLDQDGYKTAKVGDGQGRMYSAEKKMWYDGKHWWRGRWAWLFVGGTWYYGASPWLAEDNSWSTTATDLPECVDCGEPRKARQRAELRPASTTTAKSQPAAKTPAATEAKPQPAAKAIIAAPQPCLGTNTPNDNAANQAPTTNCEPAAQPAALPAPVATAALTPEPIATVPAAGPVAVEAAPIPPAAPVACRQFVPAIGATIEVPCGN